MQTKYQICFSLLVFLIFAIALAHHFQQNSMVEQPLQRLDVTDLEIEISLTGGRYPRGVSPDRKFIVTNQGEATLYRTGRSTSVRAKSQLSDHQINKLAIEIHQFGFFNFDQDDFCTVPVLDLPIRYLKIKWQGLQRETTFCNKPMFEEKVHLLINRLEELLFSYLVV